MSKEASVKRQRRRRARSRVTRPPSSNVFTRMPPGLTAASAEHFVAVPPDRDATPVQSVPDLYRRSPCLADWLTACRVTHVAMEATGVYWIPIFEILERAASR